MKPNALYYLSVIPLSIAVFMVYKAGRLDAEAEMKAEEAKRWKDADVDNVNPTLDSIPD